MSFLFLVSCDGYEHFCVGWRVHLLLLVLFVDDGLLLFFLYQAVCVVYVYIFYFKDFEFLI